MEPPAAKSFLLPRVLRGFSLVLVIAGALAGLSSLGLCLDMVAGALLLFLAAAALQDSLETGAGEGQPRGRGLGCLWYFLGVLFLLPGKVQLAALLFGLGYLSSGTAPLANLLRGARRWLTDLDPQRWVGCAGTLVLTMGSVLFLIGVLHFLSLLKLEIRPRIEQPGVAVSRSGAGGEEEGRYLVSVGTPKGGPPAATGTGTGEGPVVETAAEPDSEPVAESGGEPAAEPDTGSAAQPAGGPGTGNVTEPAAKRASEHSGARRTGTGPVRTDPHGSPGPGRWGAAIRGDSLVPLFLGAFLLTVGWGIRKRALWAGVLGLCVTFFFLAGSVREMVAVSGGDPRLFVRALINGLPGLLLHWAFFFGFYSIFTPLLMARAKEMAGALEERLKAANENLAVTQEKLSAAETSAARTSRTLADERTVFAALFAATNEGIALLGPEGEIRYLNPAFQSLFELGSDPWTGKRWEEIFQRPFIQVQAVVSAQGGTRAAATLGAGAASTAGSQAGVGRDGPARAGAVPDGAAEAQSAQTGAAQAETARTGTAAPEESAPAGPSQPGAAEVAAPCAGPGGGEAVLLDTRGMVKRRLGFYTKRVLDEAGQPIAVMGVARDITLEREIDRMKTEFVSNVSHELRTPLTSIRAYAEMLLDEEHPDPATAKEYVQIILGESERLTNLINDILDLSKMEAGRRVLHFQSGVPGTIVEKVVTVCRADAQHKNLHLEMTLPESGRTAVFDPDLLHQAVLNLVTNAIKYTPAGGRIEVGLRYATATYEIGVRDTGPGISVEDQKRLFGKFFRVENSLNREIGGTGLGLALVRQIALTHHGEVRVESEPGKGARFLLELPFVQPKADPEAGAGAGGPGGTPARTKDGSGSVS
ncbi:MAG: PAS domain-containing protein [Candidatus Riflebacteria bacterium]|nr:PAS domain-containing protein [Candidatus Riflebacteria bacterium]